MKRTVALLVSISYLLLSSIAIAEEIDVVEQISAPGGKITYYIVANRSVDGESPPPTAIMSRSNNENKIILRERPDNDPEKTLSSFSNLYLSPDAKNLYFNSSAWATSEAIHSLDIATGNVKFIAAGSLACVVLAGEYQGDLIVMKHRYFVQGGSHDDLYLVDINGKEKGLVAQGTDKRHVCPTLGN
ncbi:MULTISPECIES: hypothetical protein [Yersinia]|uniref:hypothetical protein n=1 Tax=Yersinia TaxID=629 RepID=UPI000EABF511|nr:hypothetical protein [Yersinia sp. IP36721]